MNRFLQTEPDQDVTDEETAQQDETEFISRSILVMMLLVVVNSFLLSYRKKLSQRFPRVTKYLQDATITTLLGVLAGTILKVLGQGPTLVTIGQGYQNLFMIILLPPIIFESTLSMDKPSFFANFGSILVFAIFGTLIAVFITALCVFGASKMGFGNLTLGESFAFGSLISATDPVTVLSIFKELNADKVLWSLIYGESILNDAIGLTSYKVVVELSTPPYEDAMNPVLSFLLIFFGSVLLGFFIGMVCAWFFKKYIAISDPESQSNTEATVMMITPWVSYLIGEGFELSGIVTLMFCGIAINKYALPNMSESGKKMTHSIYSAAGTTFENLAFMFIGIGFFSFDHDWKDLGAMIFIISFIAITASRFIQIYLLSWIVNKFRDSRQITDSFKAIMANSGFRGAMAFAMATNATYTYSSDGSGSAILTLTLVYACFTICVLGPFFMILIDRYDIREKPEDNAEEGSESGFGSHHCWNRVKRGFLAIDGHFEKFLIKDPKENPSESNDTLDDSAANRSMEKKAAFLQNQVVMENELARMDRRDSMTTIGPEGSESPRKESG